MKTISKILSVVLALTMVLGLAGMVSAAGETSYTKIDRVADLTAGTYYMAGYLESYTNQGNTIDWSANPYHMVTGVTTDLYTTPYSYVDGVLTIKEGEQYTANTIELVAVSGKENTYYVKYDGKYLYSSQYSNRKLGLTETATEWVATDNSNGGITLTTTISEGQTVSIGTAGATSKIIRSYKDESILKYGLVFFKEGTPSHEHSYENATPSYTVLDHFKHTATTACTVTGCDNVKSESSYHSYENKKCTDCGYEPAVASAATKTIAEALTIATTAGGNYSAELYSITGEIKSIANEKYGNMTITDGTNDLYIYGLYTAYEEARYDAMETKPQVGDEITIVTVLGTYNNAPQAKNAWMTAHTPSAEEPPVAPEDPKEIVDAAYALKAGEALPYKATLTGKIVSVDTPYSDDYKNITVTIAVEGCEDKPIQCFRLSGEGANALAAGDTITVTGSLINYNGKIEFNSGCTLDKVVAGTRVPATGDVSILLPAAAMLVSGMSTVALIIKKKEF